MPTPSCFPDLLDALVRSNPGRPVITAYDEGTGARIELSATTYVNWVHKTANLLLEEYLLDEGDSVRLQLPAHWVTTVFIGAALTAGLIITSGEARLIVGDSTVEPTAGAASLACSLDPFAGRIRSGLASGVDDYGVLWPGQPDALMVAVRPEASTPAWESDEGTFTQGELFGSMGPGGRVLTDINPLDDQAAVLLGALSAGSLVLVSNPKDGEWASRYGAELPDVVLTAGVS